MSGDVPRPSGTEGADLVAPHWPEWSESAYVDASKVALDRSQVAQRGAQTGTDGATAVPGSGGRGVTADALSTQYTTLGAELTAKQAHHMAEAEGMALNGTNHYATKTILTGIAEDHDAAKDALIAAGMTLGIPQAKMQEALDELKNATSTAAENVGQANQETHQTLTNAINSGAAMKSPPSGMPGGAGLPPDMPSQLAPLAQMATQGPQLASGAVGQLVSGLSGLSGSFLDPMNQLMSAVGQGAPGGGGEGIADAVSQDGGSDRSATQEVSHRGGENNDHSNDDRDRQDDDKARRDGEPKTLGASSHDKNQTPATHLSSAGSTVQLDAGAPTTTHISAGAATSEAPMNMGQSGPAAAPASAQQMGGQLGGQLGGLGGSLGVAPAAQPAPQASTKAAERAKESRDRTDADPTQGGEAAMAAAVLVGGAGASAPAQSAEISFGTRILAHMLHQDPTLSAAAVAVYPMGSQIYAMTCTPDALGAMPGYVVAPHGAMALASLTSLPGEFRAAWAGIGDPVWPLCAAIEDGYLASPEVIVVLRTPGAPVAALAEDAPVVQVSREILLATDPVDDAAKAPEQRVEPEHVAGAIAAMAAEWNVPDEMDLGSAFDAMRSRTWFQTRDPEYVFAMAWWMLIEAKTALDGGDIDHAAALAWQLLALPPALDLTAAAV
ncbi:hypothetical protein [Mycobacteroides abscessus]|uniref:hypothetical protein n=1 Tax=Mycobacteroides abscessus TaxID=36809 RepID=UPI0011C46138|nr:hypothetical protein [Mycobacteroides abscessus]